MNGGWIRTFTGGAIHPLAPKLDAIKIEDIAHGLSLTCRFTGQCREFYSVAQHSLLVSRHSPDGRKLTGLLHDASEAYLADIPGPIKHSLRYYLDAERDIMQMVADKYGFMYPVCKEVKLADRRVLATEVRDLLTAPEGIDIGVQPYEERISPMLPWEAERAFLEEYERWK
jgi:hypothetical protein